MDEELTTQQPESSENKNDKKNSMYAPLIAVAALLILGGAAFALVTTNKPKTNQTALTPTPNSVSQVNNTETEMTPTEPVVPTMQETMPTVTTTPVTTMSATVGVSPMATTSTTPTTKTFTVTASNYKFDVTNLSVNKGDTVTINFKNTQGFHDFVLDEFTGAKTKQINGAGEDTITFVADKAGSFEYYCSVGQHRQMGMKGTLTVK